MSQSEYLSNIFKQIKCDNKSVDLLGQIKDKNKFIDTFAEGLINFDRAKECAVFRFKNPPKKKASIISLNNHLHHSNKKLFNTTKSIPKVYLNTIESQKSQKMSSSLDLKKITIDKSNEDIESTSDLNSNMNQSETQMIGKRNQLIKKSKFYKSSDTNNNSINSTRLISRSTNNLPSVKPYSFSTSRLPKVKINQESFDDISYRNTTVKGLTMTNHKVKIDLPKLFNGCKTIEEFNRGMKDIIIKTTQSTEGKVLSNKLISLTKSTNPNNEIDTIEKKSETFIYGKKGGGGEYFQNQDLIRKANFVSKIEGSIAFSSRDIMKERFDLYKGSKKQKFYNKMHNKVEDILNNMNNKISNLKFSNRKKTD